jgi:hypothetical protein
MGVEEVRSTGQNGSGVRCEEPADFFQGGDQLLGIRAGLEMAFTAVCSWYLARQESAMNAFVEHHKRELIHGNHADPIDLPGFDPGGHPRDSRPRRTPDVMPAPS